MKLLCGSELAGYMKEKSGAHGARVAGTEDSAKVSDYSE